jgi:hypothetical protein
MSKGPGIALGLSAFRRTVLILAVSLLFWPAGRADAEASSSSQLIAVKTSRSLLAEADLVKELESVGRVTHVFADALSDQAREQLESLEPKLTENEKALGLLHTGLAEMSAGNLPGLKVIIDQLLTIERGHGESP